MRNAIPRCHPVRASDGEPNRPLSGYNMEIMSAHATTLDVRGTPAQ